MRGAGKARPPHRLLLRSQRLALVAVSYGITSYRHEGLRRRFLALTHRT
jgi:hypothetical protein